eukprot:evm.model.NODE_52245_length_13930_cov_23.048960.2
MEEDRYKDLKNNEALPTDPSEWELLTPSLAEEKARLLGEGFGEWSKNHFNLFCRASAKHGRNSHEKIAVEVGKTEEEVKRYAEVFWSKGEQALSDGEWKKVVTAVEKGEKKLEEISRLTKATQEVGEGGNGVVVPSRCALSNETSVIPHRDSPALLPSLLPSFPPSAPGSF